MPFRLLPLFLMIVSGAFAQLPETDIWLMNMETTVKGVNVNGPVNITQRKGYDNQPVISPDGSYLLYTSIREDNQADIYRYDFSSGKISALTQSPTSEYSPTFMPDKKHLSVVMVEKDSTQRLWKVSLKDGKSSLLLEKVDSVGYHCWFMHNRVALWLLTEPGSLVLCSKKEQNPKFIDAPVGRCFKERNNMIYFTHQEKNGSFALKWFNLPGWHSENYLNIQLPVPDFEFVNNFLLYGDGAKLYQVNLQSGERTVVIDLSTSGIKKISRIAADPNSKRIALVAE